jgi:NAD(P)-dependent dehydrogenase (short-subunit alcohol dehydrogenase family)
MGPGICKALVCDVGVLDQQKALIADIEKAEGKLYVLINNSGTNYSAPLEKYPVEMFSKVMDINTNAIFALTQCAAPLLAKAGTSADPARVVNISSINGLEVPKMTTFAYSTSKAAVLMLSKHLAQELGPKHITVNSLCPGYFMSRLTRSILEGENNYAATTALGRLGEPSDAAGCCLFLCSKAGAYVTGSEFALDGGALVYRPQSKL